VRADQLSPDDYRLTLPSEAEVIADLMKLVGADVAIFAWREASDPDEDARPQGNQEELLLRIAEQLAARSDVAGVFGRSLAVRVNTYIAMSTARTSA
jgi:adenylate kinase